MIRFSTFRQLPVFPIIIISILSSIGFLLLYSAANGHFYPWVDKQLFRFGIGFVLMLVIALTDIRYWFAQAYVLYGISLIALLAVEIMGYIGMGAQRWIGIASLRCQPSEFMRVTLILALARYFHTLPSHQIQHLKSLLMPFMMICIPVMLVLRQPDLGTAVSLTLSGIAVFWMVGVPFRFFAIGGVFFLSTLPLLWRALHTYQKKRVLIFFDPSQDPLQAGYHITQSKIALGSGGIYGKGFLQGTQTHLNFLPEKHTDFIFGVLGEEYGFIGCVLLIALYIIWIGYNFLVARNTKTIFGQLLSAGLATAFFVYVFINIGMVSGILPVVGIPLPFLSYGGTAVVTLLISQGLIFSAQMYRDTRLKRNLSY